MSHSDESVREALRVPAGLVNLAGYRTDATPLAPGKKSAALRASRAAADELAGRQERLFAEGAAGAKRSVLLVLQGIDTAGKGGVIRHVVGQLGPEGLHVAAFKRPTAEELEHDFLWRIRKELPQPGIIGVFDRSHYEDVLVPRVHELIPESEWRQRYEVINDFEAELAAAGTTVLKCFLHISYDTQRDRLLARLDDPTKHWKFQESDIEERQRWSEYQSAFEGMLSHCNTQAAPWHVVPSDHKWYRNWAVGQLLFETLAELDPQYPATELDIPALRARLAPPH